MKSYYTIEDIKQETLNAIKQQIVNCKGYIYCDDLNYFLQEYQPLEIGTKRKIMEKIFGKQNFSVASWSDNIHTKHYYLLNATINPWAWKDKFENGYLTSKWARQKNKKLCENT